MAIEATAAEAAEAIFGSDECETLEILLRISFLFEAVKAIEAVVLDFPTTGN